MAAPIATSSGTPVTDGSRRTAATPSSTTSGYIAMRWYQHSVHGSKPATSEKYRLPAVASSATIQAAAVAGTHLPAPNGNAPGNDDIFEPQVRGPNDPVSPPAQQTTTVQAAPSADQADLRLGGHDDAFVF